MNLGTRGVSSGLRRLSQVMDEKDMPEVQELGSQVERMGLRERRSSFSSMSESGFPGQGGHGRAPRPPTATGGYSSGGSRPQSVWKRRHSIMAAQKNTEWADFFLATAAAPGSIAAFLTVKDDEAPVNAEYFFNFIPQAVRNTDTVYKELLALYNALRFWSQKGLIVKKRILLSVFHHEAAKLLKKADLKGQLGPQIILILQEIDLIQRKKEISLRVAEEPGEGPQLLLQALVRQDEPAYKQKFKMHLTQLRMEQGGQFIVKERLFPPLFV